MSGPLAQMVRAKHPGAYDDLTDEQLEKAITAKYPGTYDDLMQPPQPEAQAAAPEHPHARTARAVGNALKGGWNVVREIPGALYDVAADVAPYDAHGKPKLPLGNTASALVNAHRNVGQGAVDAFQEGDYLTALRKGVWAAVPVVGPAMDMSTDKMMQGDIAEGVGEVVTNTALTLAPFGPKGAPKSKPPILKGPTNPKDAAAVQFARDRGVPLDAGTTTGSQFIKNVQKKVGSSYGGANTAEALQTSQAENLARVGGELAASTGAKVTNPVAAGESIRAALTKQIQKLHQAASTAYDTLRAREQVKPSKPAPAGAMTALDVSQRTPLAVDITAAVQELQPLYKQLKRESELGIPMHGAKGKTLAALDGLMNSPNWAPLSVVDAALSDLKAMARGADMPELRTSGQATAARAVQKLDVQVRAAAAKAGPDVLKALEDGRAATKQKYAVAETLDLLSGEPGQVFRQLTQNKDVGIARLRAVIRLAPKEMPKVARAFLEDMIQQATAEGGFAHADRLFANWQKLGSETKQALFPKKGQIADLDNFFLLAKRIKENPNPSGTAQVMNATNLVMGIPSWAMAKMLMTPQGVRWLTTARIASKSPSPAARALAVSNITKAAQSAGVPLEAIPAFGEETPTAPRRQ